MDYPELHKEFMAVAGPWEVPDNVSISERVLPTEGTGVRVRIYDGHSPTASRPGIVWMHGGGFEHGSIEWPEAHVVSAELAARTGALVVSVDYRLAQDGMVFPAPLDDVTSAWQWLVAERQQLGITGPLFIGGGSAGANLAAAASMRERDLGRTIPDGMLLAYGAFHFPIPTAAGPAADMSEVPPFLGELAGRGIEIYRNYLGSINAVPAYAAPGLARGSPRNATGGADRSRI
ncbi:alpha/beta hydrolase [Arthrobacter sp. BE255]|uniref:alpha/beta hydrolase n=1 Tax=Arthrobacter sp. BE255 TaxID=2817721 RepID=UPI002855E11B|nr:alpha/beta hydrolase [Arthrobacter sp. BE255]MDR7159167.1 acetyl esterase/lipase [Arthrobacter sp. BE255]